MNKCAWWQQVRCERLGAVHGSAELDHRETAQTQGWRQAAGALGLRASQGGGRPQNVLSGEQV